MIKVKNVSMRFRMANDKVLSLKEYVIAMLKGQLKFKDFWVFKNVEFDVKKGEVVGIIGKNGAGKSTLLKIIAGVLEPTEGKVILEGNVVPMLELGSGFDIELSGRENIFLNGSILGYSEEFLKEKYDEILEFSELGDFIDMPIRNYSSGMLMRLAFSIATIVKPEILIVDEILAVGDEAFQRKSKRKMLELMSGGTTVLFVSHSIDQIREMCNRVVWLEDGKVNMIGDTKKVCDAYQEFMNPSENIENQMLEKKKNVDAEKYYMDVLFVYGDVEEDYEWRVHNQKEQLLAGNMTSNEVCYEDFSEILISRYRAFVFVGCMTKPKIQQVVSKIKAYNKTVIFDCFDVKEIETGNIPVEANLIDSIIAATPQIQKMVEDKGFSSYLNQDVCSDRVEQLSEWTVYDRDVLPMLDVEKMESDMEVVNYYRAVKQKEERENGLTRIGLFQKEEGIRELILKIMQHYEKVEVYTVPGVVIQDEIEKYQERIRIVDNFYGENLPRIYASMDLVLGIYNEGVNHRHLRQGKIYAGLVKVPYFIWKQSKNNSHDYFEIIAEDVEQFAKLVFEKYKNKNEQIEAEFLQIKENATAIWTGTLFANWMRNGLEKQVTFLVSSDCKEQKRNNIIQYALECKKHGKDVLLLFNDSIPDIKDKTDLLTLSRAETYIYGSFDKVIATAWEECEYMQSYPNIQKKLYLCDKDEFSKYSSGDFSRFRMMQKYSLGLDMIYITDENFVMKYAKLLKDNPIIILSEQVENWWNEIAKEEAQWIK